MKIIIPDQILKIPHPWCLISYKQREEQLQALPQGISEIQTALDMLERYLSALSHLPFPTTDLIPEEIVEYWSFPAELIAKKNPSLDEFNISSIQSFLEKENIESLTGELIEEVANYWIWTTINSIADSVSRWLEKALINNNLSNANSRFMNIVTQYWQQVPRPLAGKLIIAAAVTAWRDALTLLEYVQEVSNDSYLKDTAKSFHSMILNNFDNLYRK